MGLLLSRFKKDKTSLELLESLQEEIETIECDKHTTALKQKKYVGKLIIHSVFVYCFFALAFYLLGFPSTFRDGALYIAPLVIMPVIVFAAQKCIKWYFSRQMTWNSEKLSELRTRKKKILDEVMDKETFRVAREILEKFAPDQLRKSEGNQLKLSPLQKISSPKRVEEKKDSVSKEEKSDVKIAEQEKRPSDVTTQPAEQVRGYQFIPNVQPATPFIAPSAQSMHVLSASQKRRLVRPILDSAGSRGFVDRLIEHLVGDGPANRYALICSHCSSHNGMALKEEFEFISFRCAYCGFPNPSRKVMSKRNSSTSVQDVTLTDQGSSSEDKNEEASENELQTESSKTLEKDDHEEDSKDETEELMAEDKGPKEETLIKAMDSLDLRREKGYKERIQYTRVLHFSKSAVSRPMKLVTSRMPGLHSYTENARISTSKVTPGNPFQDSPSSYPSETSVANPFKGSARGNPFINDSGNPFTDDEE